MLAASSEDIGAIARQRRQDLGLSQSDVAQRAGVTRQWISRFEQASADVSLSKALAVLHELDLTVNVASERRTNTVTLTLPTLNAGSLAAALNQNLAAALNQNVAQTLAPLREQANAALHNKNVLDATRVKIPQETLESALEVLRRHSAGVGAELTSPAVLRASERDNE